MSAIAPAPDLPPSGFYILFPAGARPGLAEVLELADTGAGFAVVHEDREQGLAELLQYGLSFDLTGLAPCSGEEAPAIVHLFGLAAQGMPQGEFLALRPGVHLSGGHSLLPVMRAMVELALALMSLPKAKALCWAPAATAMAPDYARRVLTGWLEGGAFPALGLTALQREENGAVVSVGMRFFTGQELRITPILASDLPRAGKIGIRLIHSLVVENVEVSAQLEVAGPQGERLALKPAADGREVLVWEVGQAGGN